MYRKYYSYNDMPKPLPVQTAAEVKEITSIKNEVKNKLIPSIEKDDVILIAVLLTLILNGCDDKLLIIAVAALLVM